MDLPNEVVSHIFSFVPLEDCMRTRLTCRQFNIFFVEEEKKRNPSEILDLISVWFPKVPRICPEFVVAELRKLDKNLRDFSERNESMVLFFRDTNKNLWLDMTNLKTFITSVAISIKHLKSYSVHNFIQTCTTQTSYFEICQGKLNLKTNRELVGVYLVVFSLISQEERNDNLSFWTFRNNVIACKCSLICGADPDKVSIKNNSAHSGVRNPTARKIARFGKFKPMIELFSKF